MEAAVEGVLQEAHEVDSSLQGESRIVGLVVADSRGLCLQTQGVGAASTAGVLSSLASQAALLEPGREHPVVVLETPNHHYLVKKEENVTVAVIKKA